MSTHQQEFHTSSTTVKPFCLPTLIPQEHCRLTFQHHALRLALEKIFLAPCAHPLAILDVACGDGTWAAEMGKLFPKASIVGIDLRIPACPQSSCFQFVQGGTPSFLPFDDARFDYVHQRCLGTVLPTAHWQDVVNELVRVTYPGGWVELMEYGLLYTNAGPATQELFLWWQEALAKQGIDLKLMGQLRQLLQNAGLTHIEQKTLSIPLSGGRAGDAMRTNLLAMIYGAKGRILALGIDHSTFDEVVDALPEEWQACQTTYQFHVAYGQRKSHKTLLSKACRSLAQRELAMRSSQLPYAHKVRQLEMSHV